MGRTACRRWSVSLAVVTACAAPPAPPPPTAFTIDTVLIRNVTRVLADDSLRGREAGTPGAESAARYIETLCRSLDLAPVAGRYLHRVPLVSARLTEATVTLTAPGGRQRFSAPAEALPTGVTPATLRSFAGRGIWLRSSEDVLTLETLNIQGGVAVVGDPLLNPAAAARLAEAGAAGYVGVLTSPAARHYLEDLRGTAPLYLADDSVKSSYYPALPGAALYERATRTLASLSARPEADTLPMDLGVEIAVETSWEPDSTSGHYNVLCARAGSDEGARDTAIVLTAHYDHLGTGIPDADGDSIFNGFSDNAAGVGMLLAIGRALSSPRHTLVLAFFTAEEKGLLGSDYFVARPAWPLTRILAVVNLDAGAPPAPHWNWRLAGGDSSSLGEVGRNVASGQGWTATTSAARANSDYYAFWREGVPALFIVPGTGPYEGLTSDSSDALRARWDRYHQLGDEWAADFPFSGLGRYAEYALRIVAEVDRRGLPRETP